MKYSSLVLLILAISIASMPSLASAQVTDATLSSDQNARYVYTGLREAYDELIMFRNLGGGTWQSTITMFELSNASRLNVTNATLYLYRCYLDNDATYKSRAGTEIWNVSNHTWLPTTAPTNGQSVIAINNTNYTSPDNITFDVTDQVIRELGQGWHNMTFFMQQNTSSTGKRVCDYSQAGDTPPVIIVYGEYVPIEITVTSPTATEYTLTDTISYNVAFGETLENASIYLDGTETVNDTNTTGLSGNLPSLSSGSHNLTVYGQDSYGNSNSSTVFFTVSYPTVIERQPIVAIIPLVIIVSLILGAMGTALSGNMNISNAILFIFLFAIALSVAGIIYAL